MSKEVLEFNFYKKVDCSKEVAFWNYWDHEHLDVVHDGYNKSNIMYDKNNFMFRIDEIKIPVLGFLKPMTPIFTVQHDENTMITFAIQFGVLSKTTININSINDRKCHINMNYKFFLNSWRKILRPLLKILVPRWNEKVWLEDLPIKLRRQKIVDMNFKDFLGLPENIKDRKFSGSNNLRLPIPRLKNSSRDLHPLKK